MRKVTQDLIEISAKPKKHFISFILIAVSIIMMVIIFYGVYKEYKEPSYIVKEVVEFKEDLYDANPKAIPDEDEELSAKQMAVRDAYDEKHELKREKMNRRYDLWELILGNFFQLALAIIPTVVAFYLKRNA